MSVILCDIQPRREACTDYRVPLCAHEACPLYGHHPVRGSQCRLYALRPDLADVLPEMCWDCGVCLPALLLHEVPR